MLAVTLALRLPALPGRMKWLLVWLFAWLFILTSEFDCGVKVT